jgi:phage terminase large subunit
MIQATTSLRKIAQLRKRIWVIQGGQGAGKTYSILVILINHALSNPDKEIFIASQELTKMRITVIKDFVNILKAVGVYDQNAFTGGTFYRFKNNSFIKFIGLDKEDIGKGLRSDIVFLNEANKTNFETYRELTSRAKRIIIDFNPNNEFWAHTDVIRRDDCDYLVLTYKDNELISPQEKHEIELNKVRAFHDPNLDKYDFDSNIKSKYWRNKWNVYGLGVIGSNPNRIFEWDEISDEDYQKIKGKRYYGVDWGSVDPWGILEAKYYDGAIYFHELNYQSENELKLSLTPSELQQVSKDDEGLVGWNFRRLKIPKNEYIICDDNRESKIIALRQSGWDYACKAIKGPGSIIEGIELLEKVKVYYTHSSNNLRSEAQNYSRKVDRYGIILEEPEDKNNHLIDPCRYIAQFLRGNGIIKLI